MSYIGEARRRELTAKYPSLKRKNWRKPYHEADQIDAPLRVADCEDYSPRAHDVPRLGAILEHMAQRSEDRVFDAADDPVYLPGIGLHADNSSLADGNDLLPGVRLSELRALHNTAQAVAGSGVHIGQRVQLSAFDSTQFQVTLGWTSRTAAEQLLAPRHGHRCTVCEWRDGAYGRGTCGIAVTCGTVLRVINACDSCRELIEFEYPSVDVFYPAENTR